MTGTLNFLEMNFAYIKFHIELQELFALDILSLTYSNSAISSSTPPQLFLVMESRIGDKVRQKLKQEVLLRF